jgi:3-hydroxyisobutyrate dehydrogenase
MSAQALITMLPGPAQVESVLLGESRGLEALGRGALLIDMSTSSRALGLRILDAAAERGVAVLDAPRRRTVNRRSCGNARDLRRRRAR